MSILQCYISNLDVVCELTIRIPLLPCLGNISKGDSPTIELIDSVNSSAVNLFNIAMCVFTSKILHTEQVPYSDGWRRTK